VDWSDWQPLPGWTPTPETLAETLDGGQAFRWSSSVENGGGVPSPRIWTGIWSHQLAQVRHHPDRVEWRQPVGASLLATSSAHPIPHYLGTEIDWAALSDSLPWRSDPHLAQCIAAFPQLRILRQPFGETLLGFLCSATKQIVQIKQMIALLAERHGSPLSDLSTLSSQLSPLVPRGLPTWAELAHVSEKDLRTCLLGFRAGYIHATARSIADRSGWLEETEHLPYAQAKARLIELPGVGEKVADCVLLFGAGRLEAFPVDTWILKALERRYGLTGWKPAQIAHFGRTHFGPLAGLAQQYLFSWERKFGSKSA